MSRLSADAPVATAAEPATPPVAAMAAPPPPRPVQRPGRRRALWLTLGMVVLVAAGAAGYLLMQQANQAQPVSEPPAVTTRLQARGEVKPIRRANVGTLTGGVVDSLAVEVGQVVNEHQEIARVVGASGVEVLTAPMQATVTGTLVHVGDSVLPGTILVTLGDVSLLQVETDDVDEFLISAVYVGQQVTLRFDALEGRSLRGRVRTVALVPQLTSAGDEHYPVVIDLPSATPDLRPGMTVRIDFSDAAHGPGGALGR